MLAGLNLGSNWWEGGGFPVKFETGADILYEVDVRRSPINQELFEKQHAFVLKDFSSSEGH